MIPTLNEHQPATNAVERFDLMRAQQEIRKVTDEISVDRRPQLSGEFLEQNTANADGIALTAGIENWVQHGLDREVRGWCLADIQGPAIVWRVADSAADLTKYLPLGCTSDVTVRLVVW